jgi:hypothetical protein
VGGFAPMTVPLHNMDQVLRARHFGLERESEEPGFQERQDLKSKRQKKKEKLVYVQFSKGQGKKMGLKAFTAYSDHLNEQVFGQPKDTIK